MARTQLSISKQLSIYSLVCVHLMVSCFCFCLCLCAHYRVCNRCLVVNKAMIACTLETSQDSQQTVIDATQQGYFTCLAYCSVPSHLCTIFHVLYFGSGARVGTGVCRCISAANRGHTVSDCFHCMATSCTAQTCGAKLRRLIRHLGLWQRMVMHKMPVSSGDNPAAM